jgi:hypothetical protein
VDQVGVVADSDDVVADSDDYTPTEHENGQSAYAASLTRRGAIRGAN